MKKYLLFTHEKYETKNKFVLTEFDALDQLHLQMEEEKDDEVIHIIAKPINIKVTIEEESL